MSETISIPRMRSTEEVGQNLPLFAQWARKARCCVDLREVFERWELNLPNSRKFPPKDFAKSFQYWIKTGVAQGWIAQVPFDEMLANETLTDLSASSLEGQKDRRWLALQAQGLSAAQYQRWIVPLRIVAGDGEAFVTAPDHMTRDWVRSKFEPHLEQALGVARIVWRVET